MRNKKFTYNIRRSIFETNSSSSHTLVITNSTTNNETCYKKVEEYFKYNHDYFIIKGTRFGSYYEALEEWHEKLEYLLASTNGSLKEIENLYFAVKSFYPNFKGFMLKKIDDIYDNLLCQIFRSENAFYYDDEGFVDVLGNIDHQSVGVIENGINLIIKQKLYNNEIEALKNFIFSNKYIIIIDSDGDECLIDALKDNYFGENNVKGILTSKYTFDKNGEYECHYQFETPEKFISGIYEEE